LIQTLREDIQTVFAKDPAARNVLELEGEDRDSEEGIAWVISKGVRADPVIGDIVEG